MVSGTGFTAFESSCWCILPRSFYSSLGRWWKMLSVTDIYLIIIVELLVLYVVEYTFLSGILVFLLLLHPFLQCCQVNPERGAEQSLQCIKIICLLRGSCLCFSYPWAFFNHSVPQEGISNSRWQSSDINHNRGITTLNVIHLKLLANRDKMSYQDQKSLVKREDLQINHIDLT